MKLCEKLAAKIFLELGIPADPKTFKRFRPSDMMRRAGAWTWSMETGKGPVGSQERVKDLVSKDVVLTIGDYGTIYGEDTGE